MKVKIYESIDLIKDKTEDNIWVLDIGSEEIPNNIHYDEVISASFYPLSTRLVALFKPILKYIKETTGKEWNWDYTVYVKDKEQLKTTKGNGYVVPFYKIN